jgi:uncharacterized protein (DUF3820 family)
MTDPVIEQKKATEQVAEPMKESELMGFGKYEHEKLGDVPAQYLMWCFEQRSLMNRKPELQEYIRRNLVHLKKEAENERGRR